MKRTANYSCHTGGRGEPSRILKVIFTHIVASVTDIWHHNNISGKSDEDAKTYQEKQVQRAIEEIIHENN